MDGAMAAAKFQMRSKTKVIHEGMNHADIRIPGTGKRPIVRVLR